MKARKAYFGAGCFWCTEAAFQQLKGVIKVLPGYSGGEIKNPSYEQVSTGTSGHAELVEVNFDPKTISYNDLLSVFFAVHDPTTLNRQGADVGSQYRSIILHADDNQKKQAENFIAKLEKEGIYQAKIVTEIKPLEKFYEAEDYHHDYYKKDPTKAYCQIVINPKLAKLKEKYSRLVITEK